MSKMLTPSTTKVTDVALVQRINDTLHEIEGWVLRTTPKKQVPTLGVYNLFDPAHGNILATNVNIEKFAHRLGVLKNGEVLVKH